MLCIEILNAQQDARTFSEIKNIADDANLSEWTIGDYFEQSAHQDSILIVCRERDGTIQGFVVGRAFVGGAGQAEIYNIAVKSDSRRRGAGRLLLEAFIGQCRIRSAEEIWLEVRAKNFSAIKFYENFGFVAVYDRKNYYINPPDAATVMMFIVSS